MAQFPCPTSPPCASVGRSRQSAVDGMSGGYLHRVNNVMHAAGMWGTNHAPGKVDNVQLELVALFLKFCCLSCCTQQPQSMLYMLHTWTLICWLETHLSKVWVVTVNSGLCNLLAYHFKINSDSSRNSLSYQEQPLVTKMSCLGSTILLLCLSNVHIYRIASKGRTVWHMDIVLQLGMANTALKNNHETQIFVFN